MSSSTRPRGAFLGEWGRPTPGAPGSGIGEFNDPGAIAIDSQGDVYVADYGNDRIEKFSEAGAFLGQWGSAGSEPGQFQGPAGVAVGGNGDVYVTDSGDDRVEVFDAYGQFLGQWGSPGNYLGQFAQPTAIAVGCEGAVYVADTDNNRVERFQRAAIAPAGCLTPASWPPPPDVAPTVKVSLVQPESVLLGRSLPIDVRCRHACTVIVAATLSARHFRRPAGRLGGRGRRRARSRHGAGAERGARAQPVAGRLDRRTVRLADIVRPLPAGRTVRLRLRVPYWAAKHLRKVVRHGSLLTARVAIVATGPTGKRTTVLRTYRVRR